MAFRHLTTLKKLIGEVVEQFGQTCTTSSKQMQNFGVCRSRDKLETQSVLCRLGFNYFPITKSDGIRHEYLKTTLAQTHMNKSARFEEVKTALNVTTVKLQSHKSLWPLTFHMCNFTSQNREQTFLSVISRNYSTCLGHQKNYVVNQPTPHTSIVSNVSCCRMKHSKPQVPPTRITRLYDIERTITDQEAAQEFVYALNASERKYLYEELAHFHGDTTGSGTSTEKPTRQQLKQVALHQTLPFIGFGFLDNLLMIVAGEYIDVTLGATLGITTMAAAALGNLISDVAGCGSAHYVETLASRVGMKHPHLSPAQVDMASTRWASNFGKVIGVTIGCLLGMFPLLFFKDEREKDKEKEEDEHKKDT